MFIGTRLFDKLIKEESLKDIPLKDILRVAIYVVDIIDECIESEVNYE